jgi:SPP1 family predicted phage head-tail adaptor
MTTAGTLDRRITLQAPVITRDPAYGSEITTWQPVAAVWAEIVDRLTESRGGDGEVLQSAHVQVTKTTIKIRWRSDVSALMRVELPDGRLMRITSTAPIGRRDRLALACEEWRDG